MTTEFSKIKISVKWFFLSQLDTLQRELVLWWDSSELTEALPGLNLMVSFELYWQITSDAFFFLSFFTHEHFLSTPYASKFWRRVYSSKYILGIVTLQKKKNLWKQKKSTWWICGISSLFSSYLLYVSWMFKLQGAAFMRAVYTEHSNCSQKEKLTNWPRWLLCKKPALHLLLW